MASKLFITLEDLKERLSVNPDLQGLDDNLASAIVGAQLWVEALLDSKLAAKNYDSTYFLDSDAYSNIIPNGLFRCYLQSGFVAASGVSVYSGASWNTATTLVAATDYQIDQQRGILHIDQAYADRYLRVTYQAGFTAAKELPEWLREVLLGYAPLVLNFSQVTNRNAEAEQEYQLSKQHAEEIATPYLRNGGFLMRPIF